MKKRIILYKRSLRYELALEEENSDRYRIKKTARRPWLRKKTLHFQWSKGKSPTSMVKTGVLENRRILGDVVSYYDR